jgi:hypothetical protein
VRLKGYIKEIIDGAVAQDRGPANGLLQNYVDDETWFGEVSGTAMLAATVYTMAVEHLTSLVLSKDALPGRSSQEKW